MLDLRRIDSDSNNAVEKDEYQRFIEMHYRELEDEFYMSREEATLLAEKIDSIDSIDDMESATNEWLDENFFIEY